MQLAEGLKDGLRDVLGPPQDCALALYRDYSNVGDAAIWLGQSRVLHDLGFTVRYAAERDSFSVKQLRKHAPDGPILVSGGGALGDYWPRTYAFVEQLIRTFPERQVVILPQSGHFDNPDTRHSFATAVAQHGQVGVITRDEVGMTV